MYSNAVGSRFQKPVYPGCYLSLDKRPQRSDSPGSLVRINAPIRAVLGLVFKPGWYYRLMISSDGTVSSENISWVSGQYTWDTLIYCAGKP